ncbi:MAG: hypothetical protein ACRCTL_12090 [Pseudomonas sp.]
MRTVSFQGGQLTAGQRRQLAFQQQTRAAFLSPVLEQQLTDALAAADRFKEQGGKYDDPNKFRHDYATKGTPWVGDCFGF